MADPGLLLPITVWQSLPIQFDEIVLHCIFECRPGLSNIVEK
ncbi:hypothetical protein EC1094_925 [Escherichia coli]|nr:hypothetical protein EC1094_925 [Escherichia coli]